MTWRGKGRVSVHIFVVEDEVIIRKELKLLLENALYQVTVAETFALFEKQILEARPDLVLLDVNLPNGSGFDVCKNLREESDIPIIFLTSRTDSMDELNGMLGGGDDYITKPYQPSILLARIAAVLKRTKCAMKEHTRVLSYRGVVLDSSRCCLSIQDKSVELTKNEMKILQYLFTHAGVYVPRMDLVEYLWDNQMFIDDNTLSVHIARIREKLRELGIANLIETKRGMGYRV